MQHATLEIRYYLNAGWFDDQSVFHVDGRDYEYVDDSGDSSFRFTRADDDIGEHFVGTLSDGARVIPADIPMFARDNVSVTGSFVSPHLRTCGRYQTTDEGALAIVTVTRTWGGTISDEDAVRMGKRDALQLVTTVRVVSSPTKALRVYNKIRRGDMSGLEMLENWDVAEHGLTVPVEVPAQAMPTLALPSAPPARSHLTEKNDSEERHGAPAGYWSR